MTVNVDIEQFVQEVTVQATGPQSVNVEVSPAVQTVDVEVNQGGTGGVMAWHITNYEAGEQLFSGRAVVILSGLAWLFDPNNLAHLGLAYGITKTSASTGQTVAIQINGEITDAAFEFSPDTMLWVGANGRIYSTPQSGRIVQIAGVASGDNKMKINFSQVYLKAAS